MSTSKTLRKLQVASPVPADIDIANSVEPFHVSEIAGGLGLGPDHYDLYGKYKAKVSVELNGFGCLLGRLVFGFTMAMKVTSEVGFD